MTTTEPMPGEQAVDGEFDFRAYANDPDRISGPMLRIGERGEGRWNQISWTDASLFGVSLLLGGIIVYSFWIMLATLAFWFIRVENIFFIFWSMYNAGRWPVTIYPGWLKWILTAIVPIAFAVTVPAEAIAGRLSIDTLWLAVGLAGVLLVASRQFWKFGVKHYAGASA